MTPKDKLFLRIAGMNRWQMLKTAMDGLPSEKHIARICMKLCAILDRDGWVTLSNGKRVCFGENGRITKGPKELIGKTVSEMSNGTQYTTTGETVLPDRTDRMPTAWLDKKEYGRLMHKLNTDLSERERQSPIIKRCLGDYLYHCENRGYNDFRCILRQRLDPEIVDWYNHDR